MPSTFPATFRTSGRTRAPRTSSPSGSSPRRRSRSPRPADTQRQRRGAPGVPARPGHSRPGELELRDPAEPLSERDPQLHLGQMSTEAAVDAHTEGKVRVALASQAELARPGARL